MLFVTPALVVLCAPHASSCVKIRTTRGPFAVADLVHEGAKACDPTVETEVLGLGPAEAAVFRRLHSGRTVDIWCRTTKQI